jgi:hypothetical protein
VIGVKVDARKAIKDLKRFREKAVPYAVRNALNRSAFHGREEWQKEMRGTFTLKNKFTERSAWVERASGTKLGGMHALLGSTAPYMGDQEKGATIRGRGRHKPIPGPVAAGQAPGTKRTKLVRAGNKLSALQAQKGVGRNKRQRNAVAIAIARRRSQAVVLLERPSGGKGLFKLMGGRKKATARLLWDVSRGSVKVKAEPTLQRTLKRIQPRVEQIHVEAVVEQLKRHKVFGY